MQIADDYIIVSYKIFMTAGYLTDCYDELGNRYQLPVYVLSHPTNLQRRDTEEDIDNDLNDSDPGEEIIVKLRLSNGKDLKLTVRSRHTVRQVKQTLAKAEDIRCEQRWFYGGKLIADKVRIGETNIPKGHLIQVVVPHEEDMEEMTPVIDILCSPASPNARGEDNQHNNTAALAALAASPTPVSS